MTKGIPIVREPNAISQTVATARQAISRPVTIAGPCGLCADRFDLVKLGPLPHLLSDPDKIRRSALARGIHVREVNPDQSLDAHWRELRSAWLLRSDEQDPDARYRDIYHDAELRIHALNTTPFGVDADNVRYAFSMIFGSYLYLQAYDDDQRKFAEIFIRGLVDFDGSRRLHINIMANDTHRCATILPPITRALTKSLDPIVRSSALFLLRVIIGRKISSTYDFNWIDHHDIAEAIVTAAGDPEHAIAQEAWYLLARIYPHTLDRVYKIWERSTPMPGGSITDSATFGLKTYLDAKGMDLSARITLFLDLESGNIFMPSKEFVSLESIAPIHSLADFQPDEELRKPIMQKRFDAIKAMVNEDKTNPDEVLAMALNASDRHIAVVELGSGERFLLQGHHRMAALYKAARDGVIPHSWLYNLPLQVGRYEGEIPDVLLQRILTLGVQLTWDDLLPPVDIV